MGLVLCLLVSGGRVKTSDHRESAFLFFSSVLDVETRVCRHSCSAGPQMFGGQLWPRQQPSQVLAGNFLVGDLGTTSS